MRLSLDSDIFISLFPFYAQQPLLDSTYSAKFTRGSPSSNRRKVALDGDINAGIKGLFSLRGAIRSPPQKLLSCSMLSCKFRSKQTHVSRQLWRQSGHLLLRGIQLPTQFSDLLVVRWKKNNRWMHQWRERKPSNLICNDLTLNIVF